MGVCKYTCEASECLPMGVCKYTCEASECLPMGVCKYTYEASECICVGTGAHTIGIHISLCIYPGKDPRNHPSFLAASALLQALSWPWTALPEARSALEEGGPQPVPTLGSSPNQCLNHTLACSHQSALRGQMGPGPEAGGNRRGVKFVVGVLGILACSLISLQLRTTRLISPVLLGRQA